MQLLKYLSIGVLLMLFLCSCHSKEGRVKVNNPEKATFYYRVAQRADSLSMFELICAHTEGKNSSVWAEHGNGFYPTMETDGGVMYNLGVCITWIFIIMLGVDLAILVFQNYEPAYMDYRYFVIGIPVLIAANLLEAFILLQLFIHPAMLILMFALILVFRGMTTLGNEQEFRYKEKYLFKFVPGLVVHGELIRWVVSAVLKERSINELRTAYNTQINKYKDLQIYN